MVGREAEVDFAAPLRRGGAGLALTVVAVTGSPPPMDTVPMGRISSTPRRTPTRDSRRGSRSAHTDFATAPSAGDAD